MRWTSRLAMSRRVRRADIPERGEAGEAQRGRRSPASALETRPDRLACRVATAGRSSGQRERPRDELRVALRRRGPGRHDPSPATSVIGALQLASQPEPDGPGPDDLDIPVRIHARGDALHERPKMLVPGVLDPVLDGAPAAVAPRRMDPDVPGRVMMHWHIRLQPLHPDERRLSRLDPDESGLAAIHPDDRHAPRSAASARRDAGALHDSAQAGMPSRSTARSPKTTSAQRSHSARSTRTAWRWLPAWNEISGPSRTAWSA